MPFQKIDPNVPGPRNVKSKGSPRQFSRIGVARIRFPKEKENDPPQEIVIATDIPKSTEETTTPAPPEFPFLDLSFLDDTTIAVSKPKYDPLHPIYEYKLADLHDSPVGKNDLISGLPLYYASPTVYFSSANESSRPLLSPTDTNAQRNTTTPRNWKECVMSTPVSMKQCDKPLLEPPTTLRTSNGSLSFPLADEEEPTTPLVNQSSPALSAPTSPVSTPYQPFEMYLDVNKATPMLGCEVTAYDGGADFQGCNREACVRMIRSASKKPTKKSAAKAASVLSWMTRNFSEGYLELQPDGACFNWCIHAYAELGEPKHAERILDLMFQSFQNGNDAAEPNVRCFTCLLHAWRKSFSTEAPERCDQLIDVMQDLVDRYHMEQCKPDSFTLSVVMQCWVESGRNDAAQHAEKAFQRIKESEDVPDQICVSLLLSAYAKEMAVVKAETLLSDVIDDVVKGASKVQPCTRNFNTLLSMYARMGTQDAPLKAENLISRFRSLANRGVLTSKPDIYTYSQLLKCWVRSGRPDGIDQAVTCFFWMKDLAENGETAANPDSVKYNTIVTAFIRDGEVEQAVTFFKLQLSDLRSDNECQPDMAICESVINACAAYGRIYLHLGQSLLKEMWELHESGHLNIAPRFLTYKKLIWASITLKLPKRAFDLLNEVQSKKVSTNSSYLRKMYHAALVACKHVPNPQGASLAYHIRSSMNILFPQHLPTK